MKVRLWMTLVVLLGAMIVGACGGRGSGSNSKSGEGCFAGDNGKEGDAPMPEEKRMAVANEMKAAAEALDIEKALPLFPEDERNMVKERMAKNWKTVKANGGEQIVEVVEITETSGKFEAHFKITIKEGGDEASKRTLKLVSSMVEEDGKWYLSMK